VLAAIVQVVESVLFIWVHATYREMTTIILSGVLGCLTAFNHVRQHGPEPDLLKDSRVRP
jgi:hypothetical protein